jgi:predicted nucleotidyltransferase component of viral defense system
MKDYCLELVSQQSGANAKLNVMREYLQAYILRIMHDEGVFRSTAFLGGTALRFLYGLPRFSEDLDFSSTSSDGAYRFVDLAKKIKEEMLQAGYSVSVTSKDDKTVNNAFIKFADLKYEAGISPLKNEKLSIKLEIDTNPPEGASLKTEIVNKYFPLAFLSYDLASLFAGKLHALLSRPYSKGRDFYDLAWYLSKWKDLVPNFTLLANALQQTQWQGELPANDNWRELIYHKVNKTDWGSVSKDVGNFLEHQADLAIFSKENVLGLLK